MSQHDFDIANQTASNARTDINNALKALASTSSGATAPSTTFADQLWYDTGNNQLKKRNEANSAWITLGTINEGTGKFDPNNSYVNVTYTPVQQGGGAGQGTNKVYIGWNGSQLALQVDSTDFGGNWPIAATGSVPTTAQVLSAMAGATTGAVGTYIVAWNTTGTAIGADGTIAGSNLRYVTSKANVTASEYDMFAYRTLYNNSTFPTSYTSTLSGTWRAIGYGMGRSADGLTQQWAPSLWLRIS